MSELSLVKHGGGAVDVMHAGGYQNKAPLAYTSQPSDKSIGRSYTSIGSIIANTGNPQDYKTCVALLIGYYIDDIQTVLFIPEVKNGVEIPCQIKSLSTTYDALVRVRITTAAIVAEVRIPTMESGYATTQKCAVIIAQY